MQRVASGADHPDMAASLARAFRVATEATLTTLAAVAIPPTVAGHPASAQSNAGGGGSVSASANRAR